jgi:hypothetical protein
MLGYAFNLPAEDIPEAEERPGPEERSRSIEQEETPRTHVKNTGQRRSDGAQARQKFCKQKRASTLL